MLTNLQPLTDLWIKTAKPRDKIYKLADGGGLYLEVTPLGRKYWWMSYTQTNHKKTRLLRCLSRRQPGRRAGKAVERREDDRKRC